MISRSIRHKFEFYFQFVVWPTLCRISLRGRSLWSVLQPTTRVWLRCFGFPFAELLCQPSLSTFNALMPPDFSLAIGLFFWNTYHCTILLTICEHIDCIIILITGSCDCSLLLWLVGLWSQWRKRDPRHIELVSWYRTVALYSSHTHTNKHVRVNAYHPYTKHIDLFQSVFSVSMLQRLCHVSPMSGQSLKTNVIYWSDRRLPQCSKDTE